MRLIIFGLGIATAAVGFLTIGFGIAPSTLSFGNFLIVAGTIAVCGGFILIALSSVVGLLQQIAQNDAMQMADVPAHSAETFQPRPPSPFQTNAMPPVRSEPAPRSPAAPEPLPAAAQPQSESELAWLRPKNAAPSFGEQALIEEMEASLSPASPAPPQPAAPRLVTPASPISSAPPPPARPIEPDVQSPLRAEPAARVVPPGEHPNPGGLFDTVWPEIRPSRTAETVARARKPDGAPPPREDVKPKETPRELQMPPPEEQRPAILKSGMIDGMAYTLYADGSIEAVLATGPIRFASIDALRMHLEKNG